jgi:phosphatidylglycerophosphate synthase
MTAAGASGGAGRRPLASRDTAWARALARGLAAWGIRPNRISQASMAAAALAGAAFLAAGATGEGWRALWLVLAAAGIQLRLLCNLLDGMVAVEGGLAEPDGPFWNEMPDRVADIAILAAAGASAGAPALGLAAAAMAVLTAYVRELGRACGLAPDFGGPMAKPHRMAALTLAALAATLEPLWDAEGTVMPGALWLVTLGALLTALLRAGRLRRSLRDGGGERG